MSEDMKERITLMVKDILKENNEGVEEIGPDDDLAAFGVNSLTFIRLVVALEMEMGVTWDDEELQFQHFTTINDIIRYVSNAIPSST